MTDDQGTLLGLLRSGAGAAVAMAVMNVATYGFTILAARFLGPDDYSAVASLMGLLIIVYVLSLGLQATGARRVAAAPGDRDQIEASVMSATYRSALSIGVLCLAVTPVISLVLDVGWVAAAMIGISIVPLTLMGGYAGILQGEHRWLPLAGIYLGMGVGRLVFGLLAMLAVPSAPAAMAGVAVGAFAPALIGALALGHIGSREAATRRRRRQAVAGGSRVVREVARNSHALLAFFVLSNTDVVMARIVFDEKSAGLYAGGLILAKAVLFLPQFVVVIAFPSMASSRAKHTMYLRTLGLVTAIGVIATLGALVLDDLALVFIGGPAYADIQPVLWLFAVLGTLFALVHVMTYEVVARQYRRTILVIWAGVVAVAGIALVVPDERWLVAVTCAIDATVLLVLLTVTLLHRREPDAAPAEAATPATR